MKTLVSRGIKKGSREEKTKQIVEIAENLVNFLLTWNRIAENSKGKAHIERDVSDEEPVNEDEEIVFLTEQPSFLKNGILKDH